MLGLVGLAVVAALVLAQFFIGRGRPHLYNGTVLQQAEAAPDLDGLEYTSGEPADLTALEGDVTLVFFGYTNCPDICPITLASVRRALDELDLDRRAQVNTLMVTVDPGRDDAETLGEYVSLFDPSFRGVGGERDAIERVSVQYGVFAELHQTDETDEAYLVDHTTSLMGIGPDGALRVVWPADVTAGALAADINALLS